MSRDRARTLLIAGTLLATSGCMFFVSLSDLEGAPIGATSDGGDARIQTIVPDDAAGTDADIPRPVVVTRDQPGVYAVAVEGDRVFYTNRSTERVGVVPADAVDAPPTPLIVGLTELRDIAVDSAGVFVSAEPTFNAPAKCLYKYRRDGTSDGTELGFCTSHRMIRVGSALFMFHTNTSLVTTVKRVDMASFANATVLSLGTDSPTQTSLAFDGVFAYYVKTDINRAQEGGGIATFTVAQPATEMLADAMTLYWVTAAGELRKAPTATVGGAVENMAAGFVGPQRMAQDDAAIYLTHGGLNSTHGRVVRISKKDNQVTELAANQANPQGIFVTASSVYWANADDGTIMRLAKP